VRAVVALGAVALLWLLTPVRGWYSIGRCFPILIAAVAALLITRACRQLKSAGKLDERTAMALLLVLAAGAMLARMPLFPRIYHLGFFQAALAGMVLAAAIVYELPRWTGAGVWGWRVTTALAFAALAAGCIGVAKQSADIRAIQTQPVGSGRDQFFAFEPQTDATGAMVNWTVEQLRDVPRQATLLVLPEGVMINYLARRINPVPTWNGSIPEEIYVKQLQATPPDYIVFISRDLREFGIKRFGDEGNQGHEIMKWVVANYWLEKKAGGDPFNPDGPKGVMIMGRKPSKP
jgi:hypothetical protein